MLGPCSTCHALAGEPCTRGRKRTPVQTHSGRRVLGVSRYKGIKAGGPSYTPPKGAPHWAAEFRKFLETKKQQATT